jgi:hypothetical protein
MNVIIGKSPLSARRFPENALLDDDIVPSPTESPYLEEAAGNSEGNSKTENDPILNKSETAAIVVLVLCFSLLITLAHYCIIKHNDKEVVATSKNVGTEGSTPA